MKSFTKLSVCVVSFCMFFYSCKKADTNVQTPGPDNPGVDSLTSINAPVSFNYETMKDVTLTVTILAPDNTPIKNIPVSFFNKAKEIGGTVLFKSLTDQDGKITGRIKIPAYMDALVIDPQYLGVIRNAVFNISSGNLTATLGGPDGYTGDIVLNSPLGGRLATSANATLRPLMAYSYMGTYDASGKPNYLLPQNETISNDFLTKINTSLPEGRPVPTYHPDYLGNAVETNANITALSDVWFTFVTEGAGYRNSIAYFTYPTNNPPKTAADVDSLHIILPNASLSGSGGSLRSGNTVLLGRFNPGTSIGFALIADGWNGSTVGAGNWIVYSLDQLNPESTAGLKRHSVLLYDNTQKLFLIGLEDIRRDNSGCDNDFNDCMFYIKSNPVTAISTTNVNPVDIPVDTDHDGVNDVYDDFPNDPTRAYLNYYPSATTTGTVAFEDQWPYLGDYDMNDLVVDYRYAVISNGLNKVVETKAKYVLKAGGASYKNGFGVEFPFAPSLVSSVTGSLVANNQVVTLGSNGCENGQAKTVIIPFDDAAAAMNTSGIFNTYTGGAFLSRDTISMNMTFTRPLTQAEFGTAPFNPFIIINHTRGREAHLAGYTPTSKVDTRYFKMGVDNTVPSQNKYYKTATNLPWGLAFAEPFRYPAEGKIISMAYTNFISWAQSGGASNTNWLKDSTHMNNGLIYHH